MPRPGGNPELALYQFQAKKEKPLTEKLNVRLSQMMYEQLKAQAALQGISITDYVREAIASKLEHDEQQPSTTQVKVS